MPKKNLRAALTAGAIAAVWAISSTQVAADVISPSIESLVIYAGGRVQIDRDSSIGGDIAAEGDINIDRNAQTASIYAYGNIAIDRDSTVTGNVLTGHDKLLVVDGNVTITGLANPQGYTLSLPPMPSVPGTGQYGSQSVHLTRHDSEADLAAGAYDHLLLSGHDSTLNLSAGTYVFRDIDVAKGGTVNVDTSGGDVVLNVLNGMTTGQGVTFANSGEGRLVLNVFSNDVQLGANNAIYADVRVWDGAFRADRDLEFIGSILTAGDVFMDRNAVIFFPISIPEPGTIILLLAGGMMITVRGYRRRTVAVNGKS